MKQKEAITAQTFQEYHKGRNLYEIQVHSCVTVLEIGQTLTLWMLLHMQIIHIILGVYVIHLNDSQICEIIVKFEQFYCSY